MKLKKIATILSFVLVLTSTSAFALSETENRKIPKRMEPGTTITFDENREVVMIEVGEETEFSRSNFVEVDESNLPFIEEGMVVTYDALGQPIVMNKEARKEGKININVKKIDMNDKVLEKGTSYATENSQTGKTTYYYASGKMGASGYVLDEWSAAHMKLPFWTGVSVLDLNDRLKGAKVWVLDRGNFSSGVILDIDARRFSTDFYTLSKGWFDSKILWYTN